MGLQIYPSLEFKNLVMKVCSSLVSSWSQIRVLIYIISNPHNVWINHSFSALHIHFYRKCMF